MESFFSRYKNSLVFATVLAAQFVLLAVQVKPQLPGAAVADQAGVKALRLGVRTVVTPPERVLHSSGLGLRNVWSSYINLIGVKQQNQELQAENQRLQLEQAALAEDARQGERLQELLAFKQHYVDSTVPAQVVGTGGSDHERILTLDKGSEEGIAPEMPVITPDGIVGRIRDVTPHTSQILEISDPTSAAGVLLEETRTRGILRGDKVGHAEIVNLMPDDRIKPGQLVLTSGGDQIFPRGLPVGVVDKVVPDVENQPLVNVILKPAANLNRLEEVLVVTGTGSAPSPRSRHDLARSENTAAAVKAVAAAKAAAVAEAALEAQRASDILAQRLPSASNVSNPDAPDAAPGTSPATADSAAAPLHPPTPLHADHYSPGGVPAAQNLTPGERLAPLAQGTPDTERAVKTPDGVDSTTLPSPSVSPAFRAAHDAAIAARPHPKPVVQAPTGPEGDPATAVGTSADAQTAPGVAPHSSTTAHLPGAPAVPVVRRTPGTTGVAGLGSASGAVPGATGSVPRAASTSVPGAGAIPRRALTPGATTSTTGTARPAIHPATPLGTSPAASPGTPARPSVSAPNAAPDTSVSTPQSGVPTQIVNDGPVNSAGTAASRPATGTAPKVPSKTTTPGAPRRHTPEVVPDDGSRPPAPAAAPQAQPAAPPQEQH